MRFVYLFKIYSNRIVKVKSAFLRKDRDAAIDISAPALLLHRGMVTPNRVIADASKQCRSPCSLQHADRMANLLLVLFLVDINTTKG